jgi:hypothetical protein
VTSAPSCKNFIIGKRATNYWRRGAKSGIYSYNSLFFEYLLDYRSK